ncbi:hypothetical protein [Nioella sp.]|jgi:hypothetical protein|uniref:hypothetical protein n=1 Tax=Nioella sp. TaxID=1912091 RepID=UPI003B520373
MRFPIDAQPASRRDYCDAVRITRIIRVRSASSMSGGTRRVMPWTTISILLDLVVQLRRFGLIADCNGARL